MSQHRVEMWYTANQPMQNFLLLYSVQLYIHITDVLFSLIMTQSLFSVHLLICFVCMGRSGPASRLSQAHYIDFTVHTIHTKHTTHFYTLHRLHTSTLTVPLSCSARKCELSSLVAAAAKKLFIIKLESFQKGWQCCKNNMCLDIITSCCCSKTDSVTRTGATKPNEVSKIQYVVLSGRLYGSSHYLYLAKKVTQTKCHFWANNSISIVFSDGSVARIMCGRKSSVGELAREHPCKRSLFISIRRVRFFPFHPD